MLGASDSDIESKKATCEAVVSGIMALLGQTQLVLDKNHKVASDDVALIFDLGRFGRKSAETPYVKTADCPRARVGHNKFDFPGAFESKVPLALV